jgi:hypothetical protein
VPEAVPISTSIAWQHEHQGVQRTGEDWEGIIWERIHGESAALVVLHAPAPGAQESARACGEPVSLAAAARRRATSAMGRCTASRRCRLRRPRDKWRALHYASATCSAVCGIPTSCRTRWRSMQVHGAAAMQCAMLLLHATMRSTRCASASTPRCSCPGLSNSWAKHRNPITAKPTAMIAITGVLQGWLRPLSRDGALRGRRPVPTRQGECASSCSTHTRTHTQKHTHTRTRTA